MFDGNKLLIALILRLVVFWKGLDNFVDANENNHLEMVMMGCVGQFRGYTRHILTLLTRNKIMNFTKAYMQLLFF